MRYSCRLLLQVLEDSKQFLEVTDLVSARLLLWQAVITSKNACEKKAQDVKRRSKYATCKTKDRNNYRKTQ